MFTYEPTSGFGAKGVTLIDLGLSIDLSLYPAGARLSVPPFSLFVFDHI